METTRRRWDDGGTMMRRRWDSVILCKGYGDWRLRISIHLPHVGMRHLGTITDGTAYHRR